MSSCVPGWGQGRTSGRGGLRRKAGGGGHRSIGDKCSNHQPLTPSFLTQVGLQLEDPLPQIPGLQPQPSQTPGEGHLPSPAPMAPQVLGGLWGSTEGVRVCVCGLVQGSVRCLVSWVLGVQGEREAGSLSELS